MKLRIVTTTNAKGWEQTGRAMIASLFEYWPAEVMSPVVYAEDFEPDLPGVEVRRLPAWLSEFKARNGSIPAHNGQRAGAYHYTRDAVKFAHKVAALTDFGAELSDGVMLWLDSDTITHSPVTMDWLEGLFPEPAYLAWLDRRSTHPETGFVMYRCNHPFHANFMAAFARMYQSDEVFKLPSTDDANVLKHLVGVKVATGKIPPPASLSGWATITTHPFVNGPLGARMDHAKGPRKLAGRSPLRDLVRKRPEAHWNV